MEARCIINDIIQDVCSMSDTFYRKDSDKGKMSSGMELYSRIYKLIVSGDESIIKLLYVKIFNLFKREAFKFIEMSSNDPLKSHSQAWEGYRTIAHRINVVFSYLNRMLELDHLKRLSIVLENYKGENFRINIVPVLDLAYVTWSVLVLQPSRQKLASALSSSLSLIRKTLFDQDLDTDLKIMDVNVKLIESFTEAHIFAIAPLQKAGISSLFMEDVAQVYLDSVTFFYDQYDRYMGNMPFLKFIALADRLVKAEFQILNRLFGIEGVAQVQKLSLDVRLLVSNTLVKNFKERFLSGISVLLKQGDVQYLEKFATLVKLVHDDELMRSCAVKYQDYYLDSISMVMDNYSSDQETEKLDNFFESLGKDLKLSDKFSRDIMDCRKEFLDSSQLYHSRIARLSLGKMPISQAFIRFVDSVMMNFEESKQTSLDTCIRIINIFSKNLPDFDELLKFYREALAQRLLYGPSPNFEAEMTLVKSLPSDRGHNLFRMITDMKLSKKNADFTCDVLTSTIWPIPASLDPINPETLPLEMQTLMNDLTCKYADTHKKLEWVHQLSRVTLTYDAASGKQFEISASFSQAFLLLHLQDNSSAVFGDIPSLLKIRRKDCYRQIKPMILIGLLLWSTPVKGYSDLTDKTELSLNPSFDNSKNKIKFSPITFDNSTEDEPDSTSHQPETEVKTATDDMTIGAQDKIVLQCSVMKTMKKHKTLSAAHLCQLVMHSWKRSSKLSVKPIMDCLSMLREKEYVEYDDAAALYRYMP